MKLKSTLWALAFACAAVSCSDELEGGANGEVALSGETGYVKIALNLPTSSGFGTKSENDDYDDGTNNEYKVTEVDLLLFNGTTESAAVPYSLVPLDELASSFTTDGNDEDEITESARTTVTISVPESGNIYGLVIVNGTVSLAGSTATINGVSVSKFEDLFNTKANATLSDFIGTNKDNFFMLNAPILNDEANTTINTTSNVQASDVTTLVQLTPYSTQEAAEQAPPAEIYVERLVAKVTVANGGHFTLDQDESSEMNGSYYMDVDEAGVYNGDRAYLTGWYLNVTNKSTKIGHDVYGGNYTSPAFITWATYSNGNSSSTGSRFFSSNTYSPRRVYWAIDGNYNSVTTPSNEFNMYDESEPAAEAQPSGTSLFDSPVYCFENTMDYQQQIEEQTTGIVFEMKYLFDASKEAKTFWVIGKNGNTTSVYTEDDGSVKGLASTVNEKLGTSTGFTVVLKDGVANLKGGYYSTASDMQLIFQAAGTNEGSATELTSAQAETLIHTLGQLSMYKNGTTYYYAARIQHFGDTYCAMDLDDEVSSATEYTSAELGRYGMVRNNWYEIQVTGISGPGLPERPTPGPGPDDPPTNESYISSRINVLSWGKRYQDVDF